MTTLNNKNLLASLLLHIVQNLFIIKHRNRPEFMFLWSVGLQGFFLALQTNVYIEYRLSFRVVPRIDFPLVFLRHADFSIDHSFDVFVSLLLCSHCNIHYERSTSICSNFDFCLFSNTVMLFIMQTSPPLRLTINQNLSTHLLAIHIKCPLVF